MLNYKLFIEKVVIDKYILTFESHSATVKTDKEPYTYQWSGDGMTTTGEEDIPWSYEKIPAQKRKPKNRKPEFDAKKRKRKQKSKEDRENKNSVNINLNDDQVTFARNTKTPGKAG